MPTVWVDGPKVILVVAHFEQLGAEFHIGQDSEALQGIFIVRHSTSATLKGVVIINPVESLKGILIVRNISSADFKGYCTVRQTATLGLPAEFIVRHSDSATLKGISSIRHSSSTTLKGLCIVRHMASPLSLTSEFRVTVEGWEMQGLDAGVYRDLGIIS